MGFFRKHFGGGEAHEKDANTTPSTYGQSPSGSRRPASRDEKHDDVQYAPPPGPPPSQRHRVKREEMDEPPLGPAPSKGPAVVDGEMEYAPPPGPPPSWQQRDEKSAEDYAPPPGPPPSYHDWQSAVPDTSLLPPPPAAANDFSPSSNASNADARRAWDWCKANPLRPATRPTPDVVRQSRSGHIGLQAPRYFKGKLTEERPGLWMGSTRYDAGDQCLLTSLPLYYAAGDDSPRASGRAVTSYFEVLFTRQGRPDREGNTPSLAVGFAAVPYPVWRMPGWERGSLAVHSDDGRRYVNNQDGGQDFVEPFQPQVTVGLGVRYWSEGGKGLAGEVFFTSNGRLVDKWSLQEEMDRSSEYGTWGIAGDHDLFAAIGTFGEVSFRAMLAPEQWLFRPENMTSAKGSR